MSSELPAAEPSTTPPADAAPGSDGADLPSLAALAIAADPALPRPAAVGELLPPVDGDVGAALADANAYDGHVALALDLDQLPGMESMLDGLMSSPDLFDVPPVDIGGAWDDAAPT
jgi:hypothetical protein